MPVAAKLTAQVATPEPLTATPVAPPQAATGTPAWRNSMLPVGVPTEPEAVPVKVTDWPVTDGFTDEPRVVVLAAVETTWLRAVEVEPVKLVSPR